ncbi:hypothetical protein JYU34_020342 [Plutella xylostella]|uniref:Adenine phosphoribosyltransferase n=1 Tax=Plutella xylostella TaxID=51655 RepID=A0ABQ7PUF1_PLUXY|nr:hypothetical protein JYU34_020342 [Plutella xylostella]
MGDDYQNKIAKLKGQIKSYPDFPKPGILFWDIFSAISDGQTCTLLQGLLVETIRREFPDIQAVVGLESRGFLFSFAVATELGIGCVPVRKRGKLPGEVIAYEYKLEYGTDILEIQKDSVKPGLKCLIIDDLLATGGTVNAAANLLQSCGAEVSGTLVVIELEALNGRSKVPKGVKLHSLIQYA